MNLRLQSVLTPGNAFCQEEKVYFHRSADGKVIDFDGYFNLFYIEKRKKYTDIHGVSLSLRLQGFSKLILMHDRDEIKELTVNTPEILSSVECEFPYEDYDKGVFWFRLITEKAFSGNASGGSETKEGENPVVVEGAYLGRIDAKRPSSIMVDICTYKRESYVTRNMKTITEFLDKKENSDIAENIHIAIVDNGKTLSEFDELQSIISAHPYITVYPNPNTGGSGGFTRGMKEALARKEELSLTHVLLMDDDAYYDTDMFVRLFGMLNTLKEEYKDITVGGAIFREDYPYIQYACGEWYEQFELYNEMINLDMRSYDECTQKGMCTTEYDKQRYSGWWCCCYSLDVVSPDNLPLPMFVHYDDIEYGIRQRRNGNPITFLNGIGVWHRAFDGEFMGNKVYYNTRNMFIYSERHEPEAVKWYFENKLRKDMTGCFFNHRYVDMHLIYMGVMDYFKGEDWFFNLNPEEHHKKISNYVKAHSRYITIDELAKYGCENVKEEILRYQTHGNTIEKLLDRTKKEKRKVPWYEKLTINGTLFSNKKGAVAITPVDGFWEKGYGYKKYIFVEKGNDRLLYVETDPKEFFEMLRMYLQIKRLAKVKLKNK